MSNLSQRDISTLFEHEYDHGDVVDIETVQHGYLSNNWIIKTKTDPFFFKEYRASLKKDNILCIHQIMRLFKEQKIPVINPLSNRDSSTVITNDGRCYSLFPFVKGLLRRRKDLTPKDISALGDMLARIHRVGSELPHPADLPLFHGWDRTAFLQKAYEIKNLIAAKQPHDDFDRAASEAIEFKLSKALGEFREFEDFKFAEYAVLHGDFYEDNVFFDQDNQITHVFDWEKTTYGPRAFECIRSMYLICISIEGITAEEAFRRAKSFFDAYQKISPLTEQEFRIALECYYINQFYGIWIERLHYKEKIYKADPLLAESINRISFLEQYREELVRRMFNDKSLFSFIT